MESLLGFFSLLTIFFFILGSTKKNIDIKRLLLVAFLLRAIPVVLDQFNFIILPDGYSDAAKFESEAIVFSRDRGLSVVFDFFLTDSLLISRIISIFYTIFGESKMMAQSISVGLGVGSVYLVYKLCLILWDYHSAKKAAWVTAIFPTLILYSCLTLRESYIVFFLLTGMLGIVKFIRTNSFTSFLQVIFSFFILVFFHGPISVGGFVFLAYFTLTLIKDQLIKLYHLKVNILSFALIILSSIPLILIYKGTISLPYIGSMDTLFNLEAYLPRINSAIRDSASYPVWFVINSNYEIYTKGIFKIFYFLYSPFIWDIKSTHHLIGVFDGTLYILLTIYLIKNWHGIWENPAMRILLLIFIVYIAMYGLGVGNFGTGIRHRSKFVVILIVLAAPKLHKFIFSVKKKLYKK